MRLRLAAAFAIIALAGAAWGGWALWRADEALDASRSELATLQRGSFSRELLRPAAGVFEIVPTRPEFLDAALYEGELFAIAPDAVYRLSSEGEAIRIWRVGQELPAAPLAALAVAADPASGEPALWAATNGEGLLRLTASGGWERLRPTAAAWRKVTTVAGSATGRLLLGTDRAGVVVYDGGSLEPLHEELRDVRVSALTGSDGEWWIGTPDSGLIRFAGGRIERFGEAEGLPDPQILSLAAAGDRLFAGTPVGVAVFRQGRFERSLAEGVFAAALHAGDDRLWIGAWEEGVLSLPLEAARPRPLRPDAVAGPATVRRLIPLSGDGLLAVSAEGLHLHKHDWRVLLAHEPGLLSARNISALTVDSASQLWVGYFDRGLDLLPTPAGPAFHVEDQHVFCVNRIIEDAPRRRMAVATANGLVFFDGSGRKSAVASRDDGLISSHVTDLAALPEGLVLATAAGVTFLDRGGARSLYAFHGLVNNHVYTVAATGGRLLAGTLGGLSELEGSAVRRSFTMANSQLPHNWISAAAPYEDGWLVGTYGGGLALLSAEGRVTPFEETAGVEVNPNALLVADRRIYAGTLDRGLLVYDPDQGRWISLSEGLPSPNVTALTRHGGTLYVGTDNGLVRTREEALWR